MANLLSTPMDLYFYVLNLSDADRWDDTDEHTGVFPQLRIQYSDICSNGDLIINDLINQLEQTIKDNHPTAFIRAVKQYRNGLYFVKDHLCLTVNEWEQGIEPDPWWAD